MKEYWGVRQGSRSDFVDNQRSSKDIAEAIGESEWNTRQIMKLNDLIPELQELVSQGKKGQNVLIKTAKMARLKLHKILLKILVKVSN